MSRTTSRRITVSITCDTCCNEDSPDIRPNSTPHNRPATAATGGYDAAEVSVVLTLTVDRGEFTPGEMLDIMRALNTRFETKEEEI